MATTTTRRWPAPCGAAGVAAPRRQHLEDLRVRRLRLGGLFVGRVADATAAAGHQPDIAIRGGRVTLELAPRSGSS